MLSTIIANLLCLVSPIPWTNGPVSHFCWLTITWSLYDLYMLVLISTCTTKVLTCSISTCTINKEFIHSRKPVDLRPTSLIPHSKVRNSALLLLTLEGIHGLCCMVYEIIARLKLADWTLKKMQCWSQVDVTFLVPVKTVWVCVSKQ